MFLGWHLSDSGIGADTVYVWDVMGGSAYEGLKFVGLCHSLEYYFFVY